MDDHDKIIILEQCIPSNFKEDWGEYKAIQVEMRDDIKSLASSVNNGLRAEVKEIRVVSESNRARLNVLIPILSGLFVLAGSAIGVLLSKIFGLI